MKNYVDAVYKQLGNVFQLFQQKIGNLDLNSLNIKFMKVLFGVAVALETFFFILLPLFHLRIFQSKRLIDAFNNLSTGLLLGISFLFLIPQSNQHLLQWLQESYSSFKQQSDSFKSINFVTPLGSLIALITFLVILGCEVYINDGICKSQFSSKEKRMNNHMHELLTSQKLKMRRRLYSQTTASQLPFMLNSFLLLYCLSLMDDMKSIFLLGGTIICSRMGDALTLGISYSTANYSKNRFFNYALFHTFFSLLPIFIGITFEKMGWKNRGFVQGAAGGTAIYMSIIDRISRNFTQREDMIIKLGLILLGLSFSVISLN